MTCRWRLAIVLTAMLAAGGCSRGRPSDSPDVAATSTYLHCAVADLLGESVEVMTLSGPGNCPGHFDITPDKAVRLRRCRVLLRFSFQQSLDQKVNPGGADGPRIVSVDIQNGLCEPAGYLSACRQVADAMVAAGLMDTAAAAKRLGEIERRVTAAGEQAKNKVAALAGRRVLASGHQAGFCRWLGLDVAATFSGEDDPARIVRAISAGRDVRLIIGNVPEGRVVADRLAGALDGRPRVVMFDNFPSPQAGGFDAMLRSNVERLIGRGGEP